MGGGDVSGNGVPDTGHAGGGGRTQTLTRPMTTITWCGTVGKAYGVQDKTPVWGYSDREATPNNREGE